MKTPIQKLWSIAALILLAACDNVGPTSDPAAVPGELVVSLQSAGPALGAIRFRVSGGDVAQVTAADPAATVFTSVGSDALSVIVIGETLRGGAPLVRLRVADVRKAARYRMEVLELVDTGNQKIARVETYKLQLSTQ